MFIDICKAKIDQLSNFSIKHKPNAQMGFRLGYWQSIVTHLCNILKWFLKWLEMNKMALS
jgi:hypothetical protein